MGTLYAVGFDPASLELQGYPVRVQDGVGGDAGSGAVHFDVSPGGDLVYVSGASSDTISSLVLVERDGDESAVPIEPRRFHSPRFAPDGSKIAFTVGDGVMGSNGDVWIYAFADGGLDRVTFDTASFYPLWRPDGSRVAFVNGRELTVVSKEVDGGGDAKLIARSTQSVFLPSSWSPDQKTIAFTLTAGNTGVYLQDDGEDEPRLFIENASSPMISPNGKWLAYASPAAGGAEVYVVPLEGEGRWQISTTGGGYPRWSPDGRRLFFIATLQPGRPLMEVDVADDSTFRFGKPRVVIEDLTRYVTTTAPMINWDTDGDRFAFVEPRRDEDAVSRIEVTLGWAQQISLPDGR
jgi:dipeptidyl aminopeptidase/acylaminoacyl peptidase